VMFVNQGGGTKPTAISWSAWCCSAHAHVAGRSPTDSDYGIAVFSRTRSTARSR
jgi:hypothetical protein